LAYQHQEDGPKIKTIMALGTNLFQYESTGQSLRRLEGTNAIHSERDRWKRAKRREQREARETEGEVTSVILHT
jgi:hypothetical protein